ncbi:MAG: leucine-rich repeat domain-containing protein, partial [Candidatus Methanoplasma sp.]|nr:leucine-rich repeat domain-containing protein [Candidatus Methanoplasma sp.]
MKLHAYAAILAVVAMAVAGAFLASDQDAPYADATDLPDAVDGDITWSLHEGALTVSKTSGTGVVGGYSAGGAPWYAYKDEITRVVVEDGVTSIGAYAFYRLYSLASVEMPDSVTYIGNYAFYQCYALASITIPAGVTSIGEYAFRWCVSIQEVVIPSGVEEISTNAFASLYGLTSVTISPGVRVIGERAFVYSGSLQEVVIPSSVDTIGNGAFAGCHALRNIVFEGSLPLTLGAASFDLDDATSVRGLVAYVWSSTDVFDLFTNAVTLNYTTAVRGGPASAYDPADPNLPSIASGVDSGVSWVYDAVERKLTFSGTGVITHTAASLPTWNDLRPFVKKVAIAEGSSITIGSWAFRNCANLESIDLSNVTGTAIGAEAFRNCYSLRSITIPDNVTTIGANAISNCRTLREVVIGAGVTSIASTAFAGSYMTSATIMAPGLGNLPDALFNINDAAYPITAISIYNDGSATPTRIATPDAVSPVAIVVYYDGTVGFPAGGHVSAAQSPSGDVTLSGFDGAARIGTSWIADVYDLSDPADYGQMVLDGYIQTVLADGSFNVSKLGVARTVYASFGYYFVVSASISNGEIAPSGDVGVVGGEIRVAEKGDAAFAFSASPGYAVWKVRIDGVYDLAAAAAGTYVFEGVVSDRAISVETTRLEFAVAASADANSTIAPAGSVGV